mgnify:CR=1 FL=1
MWYELRVSGLRGEAFWIRWRRLAVNIGQAECHAAWWIGECVSGCRPGLGVVGGVV